MDKNTFKLHQIKKNLNTQDMPFSRDNHQFIPELTRKKSEKTRCYLPTGQPAGYKLLFFDVALVLTNLVETREGFRER